MTPLKFRLSRRAARQIAAMAKRDAEALTRALQVLADLRADPFAGLHKPEPLKHDLAGWWSVRLNQKDRVVYRVEAGHLLIDSIEGHYDDH